MRKLVFSINVTLDGYIDHTAMLADDELHNVSTEFLNSGDIMFFGRRTYQLMEEYWPGAVNDASIPPAMRDFARRIDEIDKIVYSRTLEQANWRNTRLLREVDPAEIARMKEGQGGNLLIAGANLAETFMDLDLIDEYQLLVNPIILGSGTTLFRGRPGRIDLELLGTRSLASGVVVLHYQRVKGASHG